MYIYIFYIYIIIHNIILWRYHVNVLDCLCRWAYAVVYNIKMRKAALVCNWLITPDSYRFVLVILNLMALKLTCPGFCFKSNLLSSLRFETHFAVLFCLLSFSTFKRYIRSWSDEIWNKPPSIPSLSLTSHPCPEQPMSSYCHIVFPFLRISSVKASTTLRHNFPLAKYVLSCVFQCLTVRTS